MDTQMEQQKLLVKSHQMNMSHQQHQGIATTTTRILTQQEQRYVITKIITATGK
jgi:uncharacterized Zn-finger protein